MKKIKYSILVIILFFNITFLYSQNLENFKKTKPFSISGGFNVSGSTVGAIGTELNRDPYFWQLNANVNINLFGIINLPFSATLTKENETFNQPSFRQFGMSPEYKAVKLHIGYRNMSFSNYSLSGLTFLGTGIEVTPKDLPVKFSAMYGRFNKAIQFTNLNDIEDEKLIPEEPIYARWGYASKITVGKQKHNVDFILFKAYDKVETLLDTITGLKPEENIVFGINTNNNITKKLKLNLEYTNSTYTSDTRLENIDFETYKYLNNLGNFFTPKVSTQTKNAIIAKLNYKLTKANIALMYRRVDPEYKSMGTPGIVGDIEEYTINLSTNIFKNKINLSTALGSQRDNINNKELQSNKRFIASANVNYKVNDDINLSGNYSNFNSKILPTRISFADSIKYIQITENMSLTSSYKFGADSTNHNISITTNYQTANTINRTLTDTLDTNTKVFTGNLNYQVNFVLYDLSANISANYSNFNTSNNKSSSFGPTIGLSKTFLNKKMRTNFNYSYFFNKTEKTNAQPLNNFNFNTSYTINKHNSVRFGARYLIKKSTENSTIQKYQLNLMYNFTF